MRAQEFIILEGYGEATKEFTNASGDANFVNDTINQYKQLVNKNQVQGNERNIDWWRKQGWQAFSDYVSAKVDTPTGKQIKQQGKQSKGEMVGKSIPLIDNENWLVIIPLDKTASCFHGRNSDWCTTKAHQPYFEQYFYDKEVTLIYCLNKKTTGMWAIAVHKKLDSVELFDQRDKSITPEDFQRQTGFDAMKLREMALSHDPTIQPVRTDYKNATAKTIELLTKLRKTSADSGDFLTLSAEIEKLLIFTKNSDVAMEYWNINKTSNPQIQLLVVHKDGKLIEYIKNPTTSVQLAAVKQNGHAIRSIKNPSEAVQLAAVQNNGDAIEYIKNPSEAVQLAAVEQNGHAIEYIKNPSEAVQLAAVKQNWRAIKYINDPSEAVQLAAVEQNGHAIGYINDPIEAVQLAAVQNDGNAIRYIDNPSEAVQLAAVEQNGYAIEYIKNPSEAAQLAAVKQNGYAIRYIKNPSEALQLAAVKQDGDAIRYIKNPSDRVIARARGN